MILIHCYSFCAGFLRIDLLLFLWFELFLEGPFLPKNCKNNKIICFLTWQLSVWLTFQEHIPKPTVLADPTHCVKIFVGHIFKLAKMPLKKSPVCVSHAKQMKHCLGCFIKQNNYKSLEQMRNASKAQLQHLCNDHNYCDSEWCGQK